MRFSFGTFVAATLALLDSATLATTIAEINGNKFLSPYNNQDVTNVTGLVTAKGPNGIFIRSITPDSSPDTSESIYVFDSKIGSNLTTGDIISLDGRISEYRSTSAYIYLTEFIRPRNVKVLSRNNKVEALIIGQKTNLIGKKTLKPPTEQFSSLDDGDVFGLPNNRSRISVVNPVLEPSRYGMDFWESLSGELVTVTRPTALGRPNNYGDTWVVGDWKVTGQNKRGGLTVSDKDANPEAILIGEPLDGSANPATTKLADQLEDITGVVTYSFGFYRILPQTAISIVKSAQPSTPDPSRFKSTGSCEEMIFGDYNVENLAPNSTNLQDIAEDIVTFMKTPSVMFIQEIQDDNGPTNNGLVDANTTLSTLVQAIKEKSGVTYAFVDVDPVNNKDGGQPGGNIRVAYLYQPMHVRLRSPKPSSSDQANQVLPGPTLKYNPGRILDTDGNSMEAFENSRKPLVAEWETVDGKNNFFTINVHFGSKGGGSSLQGDFRPPINGGVEDRIAQMQITGDFISQILKYDPQASIITAGDFNEFYFVKPQQVFASSSGLVNLDDAINRKEEERYTYLFDQSNQELDYMWVSPAIAKEARKSDYEHIHVNSWASAADVASDHDPSVARLDVCKHK